MRKRTGTRFVPMTISVKPEMINEIENELRPKQSRSQWIANAIQQKLDGGGSPDDYPTVQLLAVALNRGHITLNMFELCRANVEMMLKKEKPTTSIDEH